MQQTQSTKSLISEISTASWKQELEVASSRYHITGAWIAIIFDPIFAITDYINIPHSWTQLLIIRLSVSVITLLTLWVRKPWNLPSYLVVMIPFVLISVQNAYTFSLIGVDDILGHSLNYIALLIGGAMFILWNWTYSVGVVVVSAVSTAIFLARNEAIVMDRFFVDGGLLLIVVAIFMIILIKARYDLTLKEIKARLALKKSNEALEEQKLIVEDKNAKITDSITYAKRIQNAVLGSQSVFSSWFPQAMVVFLPRDILSGDFYWSYYDDQEDLKFVIAADCTGHGVPAALMTVMGNSILNDIVIQRKIHDPGAILRELDQKVIESLSRRQEAGIDQQVEDGMDICVLAIKGREIHFAGAMNPLCWIKAGEIELVKGDRCSIGDRSMNQDKTFTTHKIEAQPGDRLYIYSDGFQDQLGGPEYLKFMSKRFRDLLLSTSNNSMIAQEEALVKEFQAWKGDHKQTDDVLIVGIEV